jgi:hypothetical protein
MDTGVIGLKSAAKQKLNVPRAPRLSVPDEPFFPSETGDAR